MSSVLNHFDHSEKIEIKNKAMGGHLFVVTETEHICEKHL